MVLGKFKFTRADGSYRALYKGPFDQKFVRVCVVARAGELGMGDDGPNARKWVGMDGVRATEPRKNRYEAAEAFLSASYTKAALPLEKTIQEGWEALHGIALGDRNRRLTPEGAAAVYDILIEHCKAPVDGKQHFVERQSCTKSTTLEDPIPEWRFGGILGFGGKFWNTPSSWYVTAYVEDTTPEVRLFIARANLALLVLFQRTYLWALGGGSNPESPA